MTDATTHFEEEILDWATEGSGFNAAPSTLYIALHSDVPGPNAGNNELTYASYSRASVSAGSGWDRDVTGQPTRVQNSERINFGVAEENWGQITHFSVWTDVQGGTGNPLFKSALAEPRTIEADDEIRFLVGELQLEVD